MKDLKLNKLSCLSEKSGAQYNEHHMLVALRQAKSLLQKSKIIQISGISACFLLLACDNNRVNSIAINPIEFCDLVSSDRRYELAANDAASNAPIDFQVLDMCEKVKKLTYENLTLNFKFTTINLSLDKSELPSCYKLDGPLVKTYLEIPIGNRYQEFLEEASRDPSCLKEIKKLVSLNDGYFSISGYKLSPEQSIETYNNRNKIDFLPSLREVNDFYSFPIFIYSEDEAVTVHCLVTAETDSYEVPSDDTFKFDCLQRL